MNIHQPFTLIREFVKTTASGGGEKLYSFKVPPNKWAVITTVNCDNDKQTYPVQFFISRKFYERGDSETGDGFPGPDALQIDKNHRASFTGRELFKGGEQLEIWTYNSQSGDEIKISILGELWNILPPPPFWGLSSVHRFRKEKSQQLSSKTETLIAGNNTKSVLSAPTSDYEIISIRVENPDAASRTVNLIFQDSSTNTWLKVSKSINATAFGNFMAGIDFPSGLIVRNGEYLKLQWESMTGGNTADWFFRYKRVFVY